MALEGGGAGTCPCGGGEDRFRGWFPPGCQVVFNFQGSTAAIKQLCWERPENSRFDINGYREEGTTTTAFDMQIRNRTSRYHLVIQAAWKIAARNPGVAAKAESLVVRDEQKIGDSRRFIRAHGFDPTAVTDWWWVWR